MSSSRPSSTPWEPPLPEDLQRMLPQYEISGILGRGGMGAVYKGRQAKLNRTVAIKVLPETFTKGEDQLNFAKRFEQEAQAMANLDHPAILSVYDFGETPEGQLYFVMEFIDGMDIHEYLKLHGGRACDEFSAQQVRTLRSRRECVGMVRGLVRPIEGKARHARRRLVSQPARPSAFVQSR